MQRRLLAAIAVIALALLSFQPAALAEPAAGKFVYSFTVHEDGSISMRANFTATEAGLAWIMVPKWREYGLAYEGVTETSLQVDTPYYFYSNLTFRFSKGAWLSINYSYRFGSFIVEPNGVFFSTLVGYDPRYPGEVFVNLPAYFTVEATYLDGSRRAPDGEIVRGDVRVLRFDIGEGELPGHRIMVVFKSPVEYAEFSNITVGKLTIVSPKRYLDVAENVSRLYLEFQPVISEVTDIPEIPVTLRFFIPSDPDQIAVLGFTSVTNPAALTEDVITPGKVSLNLMLVRYPKSYMPETLVHELLHQYMLRAGLSTELRWAHEGMAQYLSYLILRPRGYPEAGQEDINLSILVYKEVGRLGFLEDWRGGEMPGDPGLYYAASLYVFWNLGEKYGGLEFYKRFFELIRKDRAEVDELSELVYYLSQAAGEDLGPYFRELGFNVPFQPLLVDPLEAKTAYAMRILNGTRYLNPLAPQVRGLIDAARGYRLVGDLDAASKALDEAMALAVLGPLVSVSLVSASVTLLASLIARGGTVSDEAREVERRLVLLLFEKPVTRWELAREVLRLSKSRNYERALMEALDRAEISGLEPQWI